MPANDLTLNAARLARLADRHAVLMVYLWSQFGTVSPFIDDDFWISDDCNEIRDMPEYAAALQLVREGL